MHIVATVLLWIIGIFSALFLPIIIIYLFTKRPNGAKFQGNHVLITGGSQGIGLELAKQCAAKGANITIVARNMKLLDEAKTMIEQCRKYPDSQRVQALSCDVASGYDAVEETIRKAEKTIDQHVGILINCAGFSSNKYFEDFSVEDFRMLMDVNYFGALYATKAVLEQMKFFKSGTITFISSQGGQTGFIGMSAYSPTKFALKGLAECLRSELLPFNINVGVVYPPDTDTPGLAKENAQKAIECHEISETAGLFKAEHVAQRILKEMEAGTFSIVIGIDGFMLDTVSGGLSPIDSIIKSFAQVYLIGIFKLIALFYATIFQRIVMKHKEKRHMY
ncbi:KDSR [Bugula neritina]|uniref:3-dehydrosphinganine reductase n=1 Tax=Bugula neritina TaxID=10212 RepID=A0A7J7JYM4_BUGNE|nr:KDSR [Bugula neritina]